MSLVNLVGYQVGKYSFENRLESGVKIALATKYSYNVKFAGGANHCKGVLTCIVNDKDNPEGFRIELEISGVFTYKPGSEKAAVHIDSFKALFPYAKAYVAMVTSAGGMPPVSLPEIELEGQNIYSFEKPTPPSQK